MTTSSFKSSRVKWKQGQEQDVPVAYHSTILDDEWWPIRDHGYTSGPAFTGGSANSLNVHTHPWGAPAGCTNDLTVYNDDSILTKWKLLEMIPDQGTWNDNARVKTFPNVGYQLPYWEAFTYIIAGWDVTFDHRPSTDSTPVIASACIDWFFGEGSMWTVPTWGLKEVMWHYDFSNRGNGPYQAEHVTFGDETINGIYIPETDWSMACWEPDGQGKYRSTAWNLTTQTPGSTQSDNHDYNTWMGNLPIGAANLKAMVQWLVDNGWMMSGLVPAPIAVGYEVCGTWDVERKFEYNDMFVHAG